MRATAPSQSTRSGNVKNHEVIFGRGSADIVPVRAGELEVICLARPTKHDAVKPVMVFEAIKLPQTQPFPVEVNDLTKIVGGSGDAKYGRALHR